MTGVVDNSNQLTGPVLWPNSLTQDSITDLAGPLELLLIDLGICPKPEDMDKEGFAKAGNDVPPSVAIIEAGATEASVAAGKFVKWCTSVLGGGGVLATLGTIWSHQPEGVQATVIGGVLLFLSAALISLSIIVSSDVRARGQAASAQYSARSQIADAFLRSAPSASSSPTASSASGLDKKTLAVLVGAVSDTGITVHLKNGDAHTARGVRFHQTTGEVEVRCAPNDWRSVSDISEFESGGT